MQVWESWKIGHTMNAVLKALLTTSHQPLQAVQRRCLFFNVHKIYSLELGTKASHHRLTLWQRASSALSSTSLVNRHIYTVGMSFAKKSNDQLVGAAKLVCTEPLSCLLSHHRGRSKRCDYQSQTTSADWTVSSPLKTQDTRKQDSGSSSQSRDRLKISDRRDILCSMGPIGMHKDHYTLRGTQHCFSYISKMLQTMDASVLTHMCHGKTNR